MDEISTSFEDWATECMRREGLRGPYKLADGGGYQFVGKSGTAAIWNTIAKPPRGFIFDSASASDAVTDRDEKHGT
jgi:hypothetical protein